MGKMTYEDMDNEKLLKQKDEVESRIYNALKETDVNEEDLYELLEMERELTWRVCKNEYR